MSNNNTGIDGFYSMGFDGDILIETERQPSDNEVSQLQDLFGARLEEGYKFADLEMREAMIYTANLAKRYATSIKQGRAFVTCYKLENNFYALAFTGGDGTFEGWLDVGGDPINRG